MDATKGVHRWRQALADRQQRTIKANTAKQEAAYELDYKKAVIMEFLRPLFDEQAARINKLVTYAQWTHGAKPVRFHRLSLRQIAQPIHPLLPLGRVMTGSTNSIQYYYDVYLSEDKRFFIEPGWHDMPYFSVEGDKYSLLSKVFDEGGIEDCLMILEFLMRYTG